MAQIVRTISADASVTATAIDALDIVSRIEQIHKTSAVVTAALGRLSIAASLIGIGLIRLLYVSTVTARPDLL